MRWLWLSGTGRVQETLGWPDAVWEKRPDGTVGRWQCGTPSQRWSCWLEDPTKPGGDGPKTDLELGCLCQEGSKDVSPFPFPAPPLPLWPLCLLTSSPVI